MLVPVNVAFEASIEGACANLSLRPHSTTLRCVQVINTTSTMVLDLDLMAYFRAEAGKDRVHVIITCCYRIGPCTGMYAHPRHRSVCTVQLICLAFSIVQFLLKRKYEDL